MSAIRHARQSVPRPRSRSTVALLPDGLFHPIGLRHASPRGSERAAVSSATATLRSLVASECTRRARSVTGVVNISGYASDMTRRVADIFEAAITAS